MTQFREVEQISAEDKKFTTEIITEILIKYDNQVNREDIKDFCASFIQERDVIKEQDRVIGDINESFDTIDLISSYHQDLNNAQKKGKSKLNWFKSTIKTLFNIHDARKIGKIVQEVQSALAKSNNQHLSLLLEEKVENLTSMEETQFEDITQEIATPQLSEEFRSEHSLSSNENQSLLQEDNIDVYTPMDEISFEGTNQQVATGELLKELENNSLLSTISLAQQFNSLTNNFNPNNSNPIEIVKGYFEGELDNDDGTLTKLSTLGVLVAKEEGHLEILEDANPTAIAVMVDMGLFMAKVSCKLAQGKLKVGKALEYISDRAISDTGVLFEKVAKVKSQLVGTQIGVAVGTAFGPVGTVIGATVGSVAGKLAGNKISQGIRSGTKKVANFAKKAVKKTVEVATKVANKVSNSIKSGWKKLFG